MSKRAGIAALLMLAAAAHAEEARLEDPMRPFAGSAAHGAVPVPAAPRFALTAVLISPTRRVAVVNGRPYLVGQLVDGARIVAIEPRTVRLDDAGALRVISLGKPISGQPADLQGESSHER